MVTIEKKPPPAKSSKASKPGAAMRRPPGSVRYVRVDDRLMRDAASALGAIGLTVPDAVRLFLKRVVTEQALPASREPTERARRAMAEAMSPDLEIFLTAQDLFNDLEKGGVH